MGTYKPKEADSNEIGDWVGIPNSTLISSIPKELDIGNVILL